MNQPLTMFEAEALEFPSFADLPKREKTKLRTIWEAFQELSKVTEQTGMLIPQAIAARLLDVSPQRVSQLIKDGKLETYDFQGVPWVTENGVVAYAKSERKAGRKALSENTVECAKMAFKKAKK